MYIQGLNTPLMMRVSILFTSWGMLRIMSYRVNFRVFIKLVESVYIHPFMLLNADATQFNVGGEQ